MDIKTDYTIKLNKGAAVRKALPLVMQVLERAVQLQVDMYLTDLEKHMGFIHGAKPYSDEAVHWDALDAETLESSPKFWYESGKAKRSIAVNMKVEGNQVSAFVGISEGSEGYQEVLWNELGFTPKNGDKLIRRPLFLPLAEVHKAELQESVRAAMSNMQVTIRI